MSDLLELDTDILIVGGGAAGCVAAVEARERAPELDVTVMEKAHVYRGGCLAAGISALNAYLHPGETPESFLRYTMRDTHGIVRDDLTLTLAAFATRFVPFRAHGVWHPWWTVLAVGVGLAAVLFSVYVVYALEIVKLANPIQKRRRADDPLKKTA